jgi:hypothetical protein
VGFKKIYEQDPDAAPRQFSDDVVGRFRSGAQQNGRPLALSEWRITTGDPDVADAVAERFGGTPEEWETSTEETLEVYTETAAVEVILDGPDAIRTSMVLWGQKGKIRECDGVDQVPLVDGQPSQPCACPSKVSDRKEAAKAGHGCAPSIQVYFRLAEDPTLGRFKFFSGSWSMASEIDKAEEALAEVGGPALALLSLVLVEYTTKAGRDVSFTKPVLSILGPAPESAVEEEPF